MSDEQKTWEEMTPKQRDALIHTQVMGKTEPEICEFDPSMTIMMRGSEPDSFDWHCYKCGAHGKVTRDGYYQHPKAIPRYTTSMDAAWQVLRYMVDHHRNRSEVWDRFCEENFEGYAASGNIYCWVASWTPERICHAAYEAVIKQEVSEE